MLKISRESEINLINVLIDHDIISGKDLANIKKVSSEKNSSQIEAVFELKLADEQKILDVIKFEKNSQVIVTKGINAGRIGIINEIKQGTFTLPKRINLLIDDKTIEIPANITMVVGKEKPLIQIR